MNRKDTAIIVIINFCLTVVFCLPIAWGEHMVSPAAGIDQMIEKFEENRPMSEEKKAELAVVESKFVENLKNGTIILGRENWMMDASYCQSIDTVALAKKCFSDAIFSIEMGIFATHEEIAFMRLRVSHKGFAELFERPDMWKGIFAVYEMLYSKIDPKSELRGIVQASTGLDSLENLYFFPPFNAQVKGREQIFLNANLEALKRYKQFVKNFDQYKGAARIPFYSSPASVAKVALMLHERLNPQKYNEILPELSALRFSREQKMEDIERYLNFVIPAIENGMFSK